MTGGEEHVNRFLVNRVAMAFLVFLIVPAAGWGGDQSSARNNVPHAARLFQADGSGMVRVNVVYRDRARKVESRAHLKRGASARVAGAEARLASAALRARDEVRRARHELDSARANREKAERQVVLARENQRRAGVAFQAGQATSLETTDANAALAAAELAAVSEGLGADLAALRLLRAAGL